MEFLLILAISALAGVYTIKYLERRDHLERQAIEAEKARLGRVLGALRLAELKEARKFGWVYNDEMACWVNLQTQQQANDWRQ